jgi:RHS repeat-associated protein
MGRYTEQYSYDQVGNIVELYHASQAPTVSSWKVTYAYQEPSLLEPLLKKSNRLTSTTIGAGTANPYTYDAHGNMVSMPHLHLMQWDHRDQLQATARQSVGPGATPETTYHVYDATGQRVRKVTESYAGPGGKPTRMKERIYLGDFETYREYDATGAGVTLERETLHVSDGSARVALVETRTVGNDPAPARLTRYQLTNHLGSSCLELDAAAQVISYEEYFPYGGTSYQAARSKTEAPKRYRYTGKERDEESGLYYHGARFYAPWLGRWISCDPAGLADGVNLFAYARHNPVRVADPTGRQGEPRQTHTFAPIVIRGEPHAKEGRKGKAQEKNINLAGALSDAPAAGGRAGQQAASKIYKASQAGKPDYFKAVADSPAHLETIKKSGVVNPIGVKEPISGEHAEAKMTVRHLKGPEEIAELGTDRSSWTKDADGAVDRAAGSRDAVVKVDPEEVTAKGGRFKKTDEVLADTAEAQRVAENAKARGDAKYAGRKAAQFQEGQAVGATPEGTVRPIGLLQGRGQAAGKLGRVVGNGVGITATLALSALSDTPAYTAPDGRVDWESNGILIDPHTEDGLISEFEYELGMRPMPEHMKPKPNQGAEAFLPILLILLFLL